MWWPVYVVALADSARSRLNHIRKYEHKGWFTICRLAMRCNHLVNCVSDGLCCYELSVYVSRRGRRRQQDGLVLKGVIGKVALCLHFCLIFI